MGHTMGAACPCRRRRKPRSIAGSLRSPGRSGNAVRLSARSASSDSCREPERPQHPRAPEEDAAGIGGASEGLRGAGAQHGQPPLHSYLQGQSPTDPALRDNVKENYLTPIDHPIVVPLTGEVRSAPTWAWSFDEGDGPQDLDLPMRRGR